MPPLICLITPGHVASTPRLVKNADALSAAGYRVHVISGRTFPPVDPLDATLFATAPWEHTVLDCLAGPGVFGRKVLRRAVRKFIGRTGRASRAMAARAHFGESFRFAAAAAALPAQLYLGHCLAGLPIAAQAAQKRRTPYGFDAEDLHDAETEAALADPVERQVRRVLQAALLPGCAEITAGSPMIAEELGATYGVRPLPLLNTFPLADAPSRPIDPGPVSSERPARFYWFSQTIGPYRGLEAVVAILARMSTPAELHLRGFVSPGYRATLEAEARRAGLARPILFLPPAPPSEMVRLAAASDCGLSTELGEPPSRDLCLSNKIFAYLLAGIPQFVSSTRAQAAFATELGSAALVGELSRPEEAARKLDLFFADPAAAAAARRTAWTLAQSRFCWELESQKLLGTVGGILPLS